MTYTNRAGWIRRRSMTTVVTIFVLMALVIPAQAVPGPFTLRESGTIICSGGGLTSRVDAYGDHQHIDGAHTYQWDNTVGGRFQTTFKPSGQTTWSWKLYNQTGYLYYSATSWATCTP